MTVPAETPISTHVANGSTAVFAYEFRIDDESELGLYVDTVIQTSGFTVSGVGDNGGGSVTFSTNPVNGSVVLLLREMPTTRVIDYQNSGDFRALTVNEDIDRLWLKAQEIERNLNYRGLQFINTESRAPDLNVLPSPAEGQAMVWNQSGRLVNSLLPSILAGFPGLYQDSSVAVKLTDTSYRYENVDRTSELSIGMIVKMSGGGDRYATISYFSFSTHTDVVVENVRDTSNAASTVHASMTSASLTIQSLGSDGSIVTYYPVNPDWEIGVTNTSYPYHHVLRHHTFAAADYTNGVQNAMESARNLTLITGSTDANNSIFGESGGATVTAPSGFLDITQIEVPETVSLVGSGKTSTIFRSTFDGAIIRNKVTSGFGTYNKTGIRLANFAVQGDLTKTSQIGIDTLRMFDCKLENLSVFQCGSHGIVLRQALLVKAESCVSGNNVGAGFVIDEGIQFWGDLTPSTFPSNQNMLVNCHAFRNDAAGLLIKGLANGTRVIGGSYETNYWAAGDNIGYNIEITAQSFSENVLENVWVEGPVLAHVYVNAATSSSAVRITGMNHFGASNASRAVIADKGTCYIDRAFGHGTTYPTINASNKPFRLNVAGGVAVMKVKDCDGSTIIDGIFTEDETGSAISTSSQWSQNRAITGVDFDNTFKSTDANVLDDYEEGTWTPVLEADGTDFDSVTYDALTGGKYVKVGKLVHIQGALRTDSITVGSAAGNLRIIGLPFQADSNTGSSNDGYSGVNIATSSSWSTNHPCDAYILGGTSQFYLLYRATANGATATLPYTNAGTGANANLIRFSATYIANE